MFRIRLQTVLIALAGVAVALGVCRELIRTTLEPVERSLHRGRTLGGTTFVANFMTQTHVSGGMKLLNVVIVANDRHIGRSGTGYPREPRGRGHEMYPNGVFRDGVLIGGYDNARVVVLLSRTSHQIIEVTASEEDALALHELKAPVWKAKIEPEIDRIVAELRLTDEGRSAKTARIAPPP